MKRFIYLLFLSLLVFNSYSQSVRLGSVNMRDVVVVTNEQDTVALNALNATNNILQSKFIERNKGIANNLILSNDTSVVGDIYNKQRTDCIFVFPINILENQNGHYFYMFFMLFIIYIFI